MHRLLVSKVDTRMLLSYQMSSSKVNLVTSLVPKSHAWSGTVAHFIFSEQKENVFNAHKPGSPHVCHFSCT